MSVVNFDYEHFMETFPKLKPLLSGMTAEAMEMQWGLAVEYVGNTDDTSFAPYDPEAGIFERRKLLYLVLAHLLQIGQGEATGGLSGRISSVTEGSVSVSVTPYSAKSSTEEFWTQTPEGAIYWQLTGKYRKGGRLYTSRTYHPW